MNIVHVRKLDNTLLNIDNDRIYYNKKPLLIESGYLTAPFGRADNFLVQLELLDSSNWSVIESILPEGATLIRNDEQSNKEYLHIHVFNNCPIFDADGQLLHDVDLTVPFRATYLLDMSTIGYHGDHKPYLAVKVLQIRLRTINSLPPGMVIYYDLESFRQNQRIDTNIIDNEDRPVTWSDVNELL